LEIFSLRKSFPEDKRETWVGLAITLKPNDGMNRLERAYSEVLELRKLKKEILELNKIVNITCL
jgi:hypothetical protein